MKPSFTQEFLADFAQVIKADEPFAFVRFHDGEYSVCQGIEYAAKSGWTVHGTTWLQDPLLEALQESSEGYYVGISPPCDFSEGAHWYRSQIKVPRSRLTYATLFQHANFKSWPQIERAYKNPVLVACTNADILVPVNGVKTRWAIDEVVDRLLKVEGRPIFVAAGPCANVIIHRYWQRQDPSRRVTILDIGSSLDRKIHGKATRTFHTPGSSDLRHRCEWEKWQPFQPLEGKRRERLARRAHNAEVFERLSRDGFHETTGGKDRRSNIHRRPGPGIHSPAVRDQEEKHPGNRNVRIRDPKKR